MALLVGATGCSRNNPDKTSLNIPDSADGSIAAEVTVGEPDLIAVQADTSALKGFWLLTQFKSPYFSILPTGRFDYILRITGGGMGIKFYANELMAGYGLKGDTISIGNGLITQVKGPDEPIETALTELLFQKNIRIAIYDSAGGRYLTITGNDVNGNIFADFRRISEPHD